MTEVTDRAGVARSDPAWNPVRAVQGVRRRHRRNRVKPDIDVESIALTIAATTFLLCIVIAAAVFWGRELPISGRQSLGEFVGIAAAVAASLAFVLSRVIVMSVAGSDERGSSGARYRWFDVAALALGHAAIALLGWIGVATILENSFIGATVYASPAVVIASAATALSAYIAFLSGGNLSPRQLSLVLALFLVVGMITAMLSADDPEWWQMNLSALGISHDISSLTFNLTLIVSGVMVTTIARFGTASLPSSTLTQRRRRATVRVLFVLMGVLLACVGVFPVDRFFVLHNTVATGMAVAYAALVVGLPWLVPSMPKAFFALGFVYVGAMIVLGILFALGEYNLTAVELISSLMIFSWIIVFLRNVQTIGGRDPLSEQ